MTNSQDIIGLIIHEEFVKAKKNIETTLDEKLAQQLNELAPILAAAIPAFAAGVAGAAGQAVVNKATKNMGEDEECQGEDCAKMGEDKEEKEDEGDEEGEEDEGDEEGEEDEGDEESENEDEGEEDEGDEDSSMKKRQGIIGFRAANKENQKTQMNEALKGKQKKLDVAPPFGKLTGDDFKALRNKKGK